MNDGATDPVFNALLRKDIPTKPVTSYLITSLNSCIYSRDYQHLFALLPLDHLQDLSLFFSNF